MKAILRKIFNALGYEVLRKNQRGSMQKSIEWLFNNDFKARTILDVGASDGRWTRDCIKHFKDADYVLFEPQPYHSAALDNMVKEFDSKVIISKKAVGARSGTTYFDVTDPFGGALTDSKAGKTMEVSVTSIDDTIEQLGLKGPFLLKLDTHGFEIPILEGASNALRDCEILIIEAYNYNIEPESVLFWQLCEYLHQRGFRPIDMVDVLYRNYDNSLWQMDIVFVKASWPGYRYISYK